jgi:hypothetical protein
VFLSSRGTTTLHIWTVPDDGSKKPVKLKLEGNPWAGRPWYSSDGNEIFFFSASPTVLIALPVGTHGAEFRKMEVNGASCPMIPSVYPVMVPTLIRTENIFGITRPQTTYGVSIGYRWTAESPPIGFPRALRSSTSYMPQLHETAT